MNFKPEELAWVFKLKNWRVRQDNLMSSCPFASEMHDDGTDENASFGINLYSGQWNCYACGQRGSNIRTLAYKLKVMLPDDMMMASLTLIIPPEKLAEPVRTEYPMDLILTDLVKEAYDELKPRGISMAALRRFKVGWKDGSIQFPCILPDGKMYGWVERNRRWDSRYGFRPAGVRREHMLFGLDRRIKEAYLTESVTDMLKLCSFHDEAVATCGNMIFGEQAKLVIGNCDSIVLVPQRDGPAKRWVKDAEKHFRGKIRVFGVAIQPEFKDVGQEEYTKELWEEARSKKRFLY